jgi:hypothetical protein
MDSPLPASVQPLIEAYLDAIAPLRAHFYGVYIYGSIALGAFEELASDIDVVALTQDEWSPAELKQLAGLHAELLRAYPLGKRLEIFYIPLRYLGAMHPEWQRGEKVAFPVMHDGQFSSAGRGELNAVTWWLIQHKGIRLLGPESSALPLEVTWQDVLATMRFNLDVYFVRKAKRPYIFFYDGGVEFAVANLCRILTTIEDGEIISKSASLLRWRGRLPGRWWPLLDEAWRIRHHLKQRPMYRFRFQRMRETLAFIRYMRARGKEMLERQGSDD